MDQQSMIDAALEEAARMRTCIADAEPDGNVQMTVGQFGRLAELIAAVAAAAQAVAAEPVDPAVPPESGAPGDPRYWVPLAHFARTKARCDALERLASCGALGLAA